MKLLIVLALLAGGCAPVAPASLPPPAATPEPTSAGVPATAATTAGTSPSAAVSQAPPTPTPPPAGPGLHDAVEAGSWTITINAVSPASSGNQFIKPDPGNVFWVADVTLVNNDSAPATAGSGITIQDDRDFTHDAEFFPVKKPELGGTVPAGGKTRGYLTYQMAKGAKPRVVIFQPDPFDSSVVVTIAVR